MAKENHPAPSSDLWDLVLDMDWPKVVQHAKSQPQDADFLEGHYHETPLYLACQHDPPLEALRAVIAAHPESVQIASTENRDLPIHIACRYQAGTEILKALLKDYPETAAGMTKWGWTPIMTLLESRAKQMNDDGDDDFWEKVLVLLRAVARSRLMNIDPFDDIGCNKVNGANSKNSKQLSSVPVANPEEHIFFVHAAASMGARGCPIEVLSHVMEKYPMQVFQRDEQCHLPLHVAIQKITWSKHRKRRLKPKEKPFLESLLNAYPGSARERIYSDHHRYPLHSAIANGHSWSQGVREIFLAAPECVIVRDSCTGLFPFQLAAVPIIEEKSYSNDNLETVFQLLRARPDVISYLQEAAEHKKEYEQAHYAAKHSTSKRMLFEARTSKHIVFDAFWDASMTHLDALFRLRKCLYKTRR
mmetsp:Transcript_22136/g.54780  ORF Transcript_22136/g.54780 Transcript_22136/m.54780 type:complete len:417 (+) Transcript_22136:129-1379(+)